MSGPPDAADASAERLTEELVRAALDVRTQAYAPYSGFAVGAAVRGESGAIYVGVNVENASYPCGICAEQSAVTSAVTAGERRIVGLVVVTPLDPPAMPCGMCRQVLHEFNPNLPVVVVSPSGARAEALLSELMPYGFGGAALAAGQATEAGDG